MSIYTNTGLVKHAEAALKLKTKYMWAGTLYPISVAYIAQKVNQCKDIPAKTTGYTADRIKALNAVAGKGYYGVDCVCLIKSYIWSGKPDGGVKSPAYNGSTDVDALKMYRIATVKGKIKDLPEIPGLIVFDSRTHHVGIYVGGGYTIESTLGTRGDGVVKRKLDNLWTDWFQCPFIDYPVAFAINDKIHIKTSAANYAGSTIKIPAKYKGTAQTYTIAKINGEKALIKELFSWVNLADLEKSCL